jgi:hypothetical protein
MDYIDFVLESTRYYNSNRADYRFGQAVYNKLNEIRPDIANKIIGTQLDPYYKTSVETNVWEFIRKNW